MDEETNKIEEPTPTPIYSRSDLPPLPSEEELSKEPSQPVVEPEASKLTKETNSIGNDKLIEQSNKIILENDTSKPNLDLDPDHDTVPKTSSGLKKQGLEALSELPKEALTKVEPKKDKVIPQLPKESKPLKLPNLSLPLLPLVTILLVLIVMFLTFSLIQLNEQLRVANEQIKRENDGLVTEKDELLAELGGLVTDNDELQRIIDELSGQVEDLEDCDPQKVNIGIASYNIPCNWSGYFDLAYSEQEESRGFAGPSPIIEVADANTRSSKVLLTVTRFSEVFDNESDDPVTPILNDYKDDGYTVVSFTNKKGVLFYQVTVSEGGQTYANYFAQTDYKNDVYMIQIEDKLSSNNDDKTIVDSFQWDI